MTDMIAQYRADAARIKARRDDLKAELDEAIAKGDESATIGLRKRVKDLDDMHYNIMQAVDMMSK